MEAEFWKRGFLEGSLTPFPAALVSKVGQEEQLSLLRSGPAALLVPSTLIFSIQTKWQCLAFKRGNEYMESVL